MLDESLAEYCKCNTKAAVRPPSQLRERTAGAKATAVYLYDRGPNKRIGTQSEVATQQERMAHPNRMD